jgi:3-oxoacyl-(acyl-carrier-protein) synthase
MKQVVALSSVRLEGPDPDFREYIPPMQARRMSTPLKRILVCARQALEQAGIAMPDAILCGTRLGLMDHTNRILDCLRENGEENVSPTDFMQSTHNTLASTIAIQVGCHGYNCTYSQGDDSFENALLDARLLLEEGSCQTALVCTEDYATVLTVKADG